MRSRKIPTPDVPEAERARLQKLGEYDEKVEDTQFLYLTCDLPPMPLYPDELKENIIPQVTISHKGFHTWQLMYYPTGRYFHRRLNNTVLLM